jgi:DNA adenine methylase
MSTAELLQQTDLSFPDTRYMGSKRKLLPSLNKIFEELNFDSALDAFSGTSSVAYLLKMMGKRVHANDYLLFNSYIGKALIENSNITLSESEIDELIQFSPDADNFIEKEFSGIYFDKKDCRWLDSAFANIQFLDNEYKKAIALTALCRACIKKRPRGIFTYTGMRYDDGRKDLRLALADQFINAVELINKSVFSNGKKNLSHNKDIMEFTKKDYDLVYFDPPYFSLKSDNEYSRRYHFLEGLVSYWSHVDIDYTTKTKKIKRVESDFTIRNKVVPAFESLFDKFNKSIFAVSYSSNCFPDAKLMKSILKNAGKEVELIELDYVYSVGTHAHKKNNANNQVKEYVFLGL